MCQSQWCWYVRKELCLKNIGLSGIHPKRFAYLQWRVPIGVALTYRLIVALYCTGWLIYTSRSPDILINGAYVKQYAFLTMWTYLVLTVYFILHFIVCLIHICERDTNACNAPAPETHRQLFEELSVYPSLWQGQRSEYMAIHSSNESGEMERDIRRETETMKPFVARLHKFVWVFYNIAATACIMVTIIFWSMLYPGMSISGIDLVVNFQLHAVTSILVVIETILTAVPVRVMHFVYALLYGLLYIAFSGVYYAVDHRHVLYPDVLDWRKPGRTVIVILVAGFIGLPLIQFLLFLIYKLRLYIFNRCTQQST